MSRIKSVDTVRIIAIIAVIILHTHPFALVTENDLYKYLMVFFNQMSRFAVPFFFIVSGYFYGKKLINKSSIIPVSLSIINRLGIIFLFWSVVYLFPFDLFLNFEYQNFNPINVIYQNILEIIHDPLHFLFHGSKVHLWFLPALVSALLITAIFLYFNAVRLLVITAVLLYIFGLCAKPYSEMISLPYLGFDFNKGPFFSLLYFVTGYMFSHFRITVSYFFYGYFVTFFGIILHFLEMYYLYSYYAVYPLRHEFLIGTYFFGVGVSMIALSNHKFLNSDRVSSFGKYTLGIYVVHYIFVDLLRYVDQQLSNPLWEVGYVFIVLLLSMSMIFLLTRFNFMKKVLM